MCCFLVWLVCFIWVWLWVFFPHGGTIFLVRDIFYRQLQEYNLNYTEIPADLPVIMRGSNKESPSFTAVINQPSISITFIPCLFCHAKHFQTHLALEFAENQCCLPRNSYKHLNEFSSSFGVKHERNRTRLPELWGSVWLPDSWSWSHDHYPRPHVRPRDQIPTPQSWLQCPKHTASLLYHAFSLPPNLVLLPGLVGQCLMQFLSVMEACITACTWKNRKHWTLQCIYILPLETLKSQGFKASSWKQLLPSKMTACPLGPKETQEHCLGKKPSKTESKRNRSVFWRLLSRLLNNPNTWSGWKNIFYYHGPTTAILFCHKNLDTLSSYSNIQDKMSAQT